MKQSTWLFIVFLLLMFSLTSHAQISSNQLGNNRAAQYFLGGEDQVLMPINVWGFVLRPGQYMVPFDTDLVSLLSFAGGPQEDAKIKSIRVVRASTKENEDGQVIDVDVKAFLKNGSSDLIPVLRPGDTVVVYGTTMHFVQKFFEFTYRIAILAQVYALITYYHKR